MSDSEKRTLDNFSKREPYFKKIIYEMLKNNISPTKENIQNIIKKYNFKSPTLANRVEDYFEKNNVDNIKTLIINKYDSSNAKNELNVFFDEKKDKPVDKNSGSVNIENVSSLPISVVGMLKEYHETFKQLDSVIKDSDGYEDTIYQLLSAHILPASKEGRKIIENNHLDADIIIKYFDILDRITLGLSISENHDKIRKLINSLSDIEYDFITDLESEGLTLDDPEGQQMLSERCVRRELIEELYGLKKESENAKKVQQVQKKFEELNAFEKCLIEDLESEGLTLNDPEGQQMLSERCVRRDKILEYFKLRDGLKLDLSDLKDKTMEDTPQRNMGEENKGPVLPDYDENNINVVLPPDINKGNGPVLPEENNNVVLPPDISEGNGPVLPPDEEDKGPVLPSPEETPGPVLPPVTDEEKKTSENPFADYRMNDAYLTSLEDSYQRQLREQRAREQYESERKSRSFFARVKRFFGSKLGKRKDDPVRDFNRRTGRR